MGGVSVTPEELEALVHDEYVPMVRAVAVACGSTAAAEDAVQEALVRAWERAGKGQQFSHLAGWVVTVALNQVRGGQRRLGAERRALTRVADAAADRSSPDAEALVDLRGAIGDLPTRQREAIVLHHLVGLDVAATAELLGVSESTVKTALQRGRATLAAALAVAIDEEDLTP